MEKVKALENHSHINHILERIFASRDKLFFVYYNTKVSMRILWYLAQVSMEESDETKPKQIEMYHIWWWSPHHVDIQTLVVMVLGGSARPERRLGFGV